MQVPVHSVSLDLMDFDKLQELPKRLPAEFREVGLAASLLAAPVSRCALWLPAVYCCLPVVPASRAQRWALMAVSRCLLAALREARCRCLLLLLFQTTHRRLQRGGAGVQCGSCAVCLLLPV